MICRRDYSYTGFMLLFLLYSLCVERILSARQLLGLGLDSTFPCIPNGGTLQDETHFAE